MRWTLAWALFVSLLVAVPAPAGADVGGYPQDYQFATGFSSTQGQNRWSYLESDGTNYWPLTWDAANVRWHSATCQWCLIGQNLIHPDTRDAVIAWTAPRAGMVAVRGTIDHGLTTPDSDGVRAVIRLKSGTSTTKVWPSAAYQDIRPGFMATHVFKTWVNAGDQLLFDLNHNVTSVDDASRWNPRVTYDYEPKFTLDQAELVMGPDDFGRIGISDALDASMSVVPDGNQFDFFTTSTFGTDTVKFRGSLDQPAQTSVYSGYRIVDPSDANDRWWIENVYRASSGALLAFCHMEKRTPGSDVVEYAGGLAYSTDGGTTFTLLGKTLTAPDVTGNIEGMPYVVSDGYLYVYFMQDGRPAVARAQLSQVLADASQLRVGAWSKYFDGGWTEPGLGGQVTGTTIVPPSPTNGYGAHGDAAYSTYLGKYLLAGSSDGPGAGVYLTFGDDPTNFEVPSWIQTSNANGKTTLSPYETIVNVDGSDNGVVGQSFYVYFGYYFTWPPPADPAALATTARWLYRQKVTLNSAGFAKNTIDASAEYTDKQGENGWSYSQYSGATGYTNLTWNDTDDRWHGTNPYTQTTSTGFHPDGPGVDTVKVWTAPRAGTVQISAGLGGGITVANGTAADGVDVLVRTDDGEVWPSSGYQWVQAGTSVAFPTTTVTVTQNEKVYFHVGQHGNNAFDSTNWVPVITYTGTSRPTYNAWADFGPMQGGSQWEYDEYDSTSGLYTPMTYDAVNVRWQGSAQYLQIGPVSQHPDNGKDSVRAWVAPRAGTVRIMSMLGDLSSLDGSDGAQVKVMKNDTNIWPASGYVLITPGHPASFPAIDVSVDAGDVLSFHEQQNVTTAYDTLQWVPQISYY